MIIMNKIKLGDFILNFDEVLWIKKVGCGARVKFKGVLFLGKDMVRENILEISFIPEEDWKNIYKE